MTTAVSVPSAVELDARDLAEKLDVRLDEGSGLYQALLTFVSELIVIGGWRAGKSTVLALKLFFDFWLRLLAGDGDKDLLYWIIAADYQQTHAEFTYIDRWLTKLRIPHSFNHPKESPWEVEFSFAGFHVFIEAKSAAYPEKLGSVAPHGILVCEAGQISGEVVVMLQGRTMEKAAPIWYGGTLEDDEGHQQWAWYQESAQDWKEAPNQDHAAFSLPSWENLSVFGDCRPHIRGKPALAAYCPDENHGTAHSGRNHPEIRYREQNWDAYTFKRRIAAEPTGIQFAVYPQLLEQERVGLSFLRSMPTYLLDPAYRWKAVAGGIDYGTVHPSAAVVITETQDGVLWVRECHFQKDAKAGDTHLLHEAKRFLSRKYGCWRWNTDPNERYMANSYEADAVSYSESSRGFRIGLTGTRLDYNGLYFNLDGPGVPDLYAEMKTVHRRKQKDGELKLVRLNDDRTASLENAVEIIDGKPRRETPQPATMRQRRVNRVRELRRV